MPWLIVILSYLLGSIPTAYIASRWLRGKDNMGAANAYRKLGAKTGIAVGFIDAGKGALAILIAQVVDLSLVSVLLAGTATVVGHNWPVFLGFRGGRGESTTIGVLLALVTQPLLITAGPSLATLFITRNVTKASAVLFIPLPLVCWWSGGSGQLLGYSIFLPCLVGFTHYLRARHLPVRQNP